MKDHEGDYKGFIHTGEAWYAKTVLFGDILDSISIGWYCPGGGTSGEFNVVWSSVGGKPCPRLRLFSDAWDCFATMPELFSTLANYDDVDLTPQELRDLLLALGYKDDTPRDAPYRDKSGELIESAKAKLTAEEFAALKGLA